LETESPAAGGTIYRASRLVVDAVAAAAPGALAVSRGTVVAAGTPRDVDRAVPAGFARVDLPGAAIVPGLVNAHTHLQIPPPGGFPDGPRPEGGHASFPGTPAALSFVEWLLRIVAWRLTADPGEFRRNMDRAAAAAAAAGTTAVGEIGGPDPDAYAGLPLRARVFAEGIGFLPGEADRACAAVERVIGALEAAFGSSPLHRLGVAPHTLYTVGSDLLARLGDLARSRGLPVCLHLAESPAEMEFLRCGTGDIARTLYPAVGRDVTWFGGIGTSIPAYLEAAGILGEGLLLVHNVHLSGAEIAALRDAGARFVLCPRSNRAHGNGSPDVTGFVDAAIPFALGTDSLASVPDLSLWEEMREARDLYRGRLDDAALCAVLFRAATAGGAGALGLPGGVLRPGAPADFAVVDDPGGDTAVDFRRLVERSGAASVRLAAVEGRILFDRT